MHYLYIHQYNFYNAHMDIENVIKIRWFRQTHLSEEQWADNLAMQFTKPKVVVHPAASANQRVRYWYVLCISNTKCDRTNVYSLNL